MPADQIVLDLNAFDCAVGHAATVMFGAVAETVKQFGTIDVLINNAAYFMSVWKGPFWEMSVEEFGKAMAVNVRGSWHFLHRTSNTSPFTTP